MAGKKKKMTPAQAAAARRERTPESVRRAEAQERARLIKKSAQEAQRKASKAGGTRLAMPFIVVAVVVVLALVVTIAPGLFMGQA